MEVACAQCNDADIQGFCELCDQFPQPAEAVQACSGYDQPVTRPFDFILGLVFEVIDVQRTTHLHLVRGGFQRFAQSKLVFFHKLSEFCLISAFLAFELILRSADGV
jgi:hypothetical protein